MSEHSILPPSSAARRMACSGSRALEARYPEEDSEHTRVGHAAHWVAAIILNAGEIKVGDVCPNGEIVTQEMLDGGILYADQIADILPSINSKNDLHIEEKIDISCIHPLMFGTPDAWFFDEKLSLLHVFDYKFGHRYVDVFENWQLLAYAAGIDDFLRSKKYLIDEIHFTIVQPRCYHTEGPVRKWQISYEQILPYFSRLKHSEFFAMQSDALCTPNPECGDCSARHACEALQRAALSKMEIATKNTPHELTPQQVGHELKYLHRAAELLDARITGLEQQAMMLIKNGKTVSNYILEQTKGRERWNRSAEEILILGELFNCNLKKPNDLITPKQAIKAGVPEDIVKNYCEIPTGNFKLVRDDCKKSRKIFSEK